MLRCSNASASSVLLDPGGHDGMLRGEGVCISRHATPRSTHVLALDHPSQELCESDARLETLEDVLGRFLTF